MPRVDSNFKSPKKLYNSFRTNYEILMNDEIMFNYIERDDTALKGLMRYILHGYFISDKYLHSLKLCSAEMGRNYALAPVS